MAFRELKDSAIIDCFNKKLSNMSFIPTNDIPKIRSWVNSLIEENKSRYEKAMIAKDMWKYFMKKSLLSISENLRGYDRLCNYFDEFVEYENVLFSIDDYYRDHTIHTIWVMMLGFYLRDNFITLKELNYSHVTSIFEESAKVGNKGEKETLDSIRKNYEQALWCLISLTHDLGYPIERTKRASQVMAKMIKNFGILSSRNYEYNFNIIHKTAIDELLKMINSNVVWVDDSNFLIVHPSGQILDYAKSFERLDHGIMSAYLIQQYLDVICDNSLNFNIENIYWTDKEKAVMNTIISTWLESISSHTNIYRYTNLNYPLNMSDLLLISDELEEFSRYAKSKKNKEWSEVKIRTELNLTKTQFGIRHIIDDQNIPYEIEPIFIKKVLKFHNAFEVTDTVPKMFVYCKDIRKNKKINCTYKKDICGLEIDTPRGKYNDIFKYIEDTKN